ncbi:hypothetical protein BRDID11002_15190 [Bradyrhizobium diazoefficiens]
MATPINGIEPDRSHPRRDRGPQAGARRVRILRTVPGFEKSYIVDLPPQLGIRETRRIKGRLQLSGEDVLGCASFEDSIGVNGWPIEAHVPGDVIFTFPPIPNRAAITSCPTGCWCPRRRQSAGRRPCASMTHEGQSAARVSGACFVMGEAAGSRAALALSGNRIPRDIPH